MNIGVILARSGSKGIPNKNIVEVAGKPLITFMLEALVGSRVLDYVYVSTDSDEIAKVALSVDSSIRIFHRSNDFTKDESASDSALIELLSSEDFSREAIIVFAQLTSPLTTARDVREAVALFDSSDASSLVSVVRQKRFLWTKDGTAVNYDPKFRPRRQEFEGFLVENGALYISSAQ